MEVRQFMDCFRPMPVVGRLAEDWWGADTVVPRDQDNGLEDPVLWYSAGLYHCVVNQWSSRKTHYIISENGVDR